MPQESDQISNALTNSVPTSRVPTNIITGFLGAGKTSTILHLLKSKPSHERWAVLVNEFGEIGIDGALFEGQYSEQQGVYIREVPGGCMCCTAGLPMRVALAQLLRKAKPDVLAIQNIVTLVDARHLSDSRYAKHETFQQQIAIADIVVGNKQDLYSEEDKAALVAYLGEYSLGDIKLIFTEQGVIEPPLLDGPKIMASENSIDVLMPISEDDHDFITPIPESGFIKALNHGEGFVSAGWRFSQRFEFDQNNVFAFLSGITAERLKATFITNNGCFAYNLTRDTLTEIPFDQLDESRIEIIAREQNQDWETELFNCVNSANSAT